MSLAQRVGVVVAVVLGTVAPAAPAGAKADRPESCRLLRTAEVSEAFTQPTTSPAPGHAPLLCDFLLSATDTRPAGVVSVYLKRGNGAAGDFDLARDFSGDTRVKLHGLGRRAFYAPDYGAVYVLRDPATILFVQGLFPANAVDGTGLQSALVGLAGKATHRA